MYYERYCHKFYRGGYATPLWLRKGIYNLFGMKIRKCHISPKCFFGSKRIEIGEGTFINYRCFFDGANNISIGKNCRIAMNCSFITSTHVIGDETMRASEGISKPITIGNGCWIGSNSTVLPGVNIGNGTIIAAGSVVVHDCEENSLYAGVPAKKIKQLS